MSRFKNFIAELSQLSKVKAESFCLDLGSSYTKLVRGKQLVYCQPSCLTIHQASNTVVEIGERAFALLGKTPPGLETVFPVKFGLVSDPNYATLYLQALLEKYLEPSPWLYIFRPDCRCDVPSLASELDKATLDKVLSEVGFGRIKLVSKAGALAARLKRPDNPDSAVCVVDVGGDTTEVVFFSGKRPVISKTIQIGGWSFSQIIRTVLKTEYHCEIGWQTAEKIKHQLISLKLGTKGKGNTTKLTIRGKDIIHSLPLTVQVSTEVLATHFEVLAEELLAEIQLVLDRVPAELVSLSLSNGLYLTGGGSKLAGLGEFLSERLQTQIIRSASPQEDVIRGLEMI